MKLTIFYRFSKCSQVLHLSDSFALDRNGERLTFHNMLQKAADLAWDFTGSNPISGPKYIDFHLDSPIQDGLDED